MSASSRSLDFYRAQLRVNKYTLDDALETHAEHQEEISRQTAAWNSACSEAKELLARVEARLADNVRDGNVKASVESVKSAVLRMPERQEAWKSYNEVRETYEQWLGLLSAWQQRGYSIKTLADLYGHDYYAPRSISDAQASQASRHDDLRSRMRAATGSTTGRVRVTV